MKFTHIALALATTLLSCQHAMASSLGLEAEDALVGWRNSSNSSDNMAKAADYPSKKVRCGNKLYPSHPQQTLKEYHLQEWSPYDGSKLPANSRVCLVRTNGGNHSCIAPDYAEHVVISDLFVDACGEYYRGFEEIAFLHQDESMGTLFSPGRTMYPTKNSEFAKDMSVGGTYAVPLSKFIKIAAPFPEDIQKAELNIQQALQSGFSYDPKSHTFTEPK